MQSAPVSCAKPASGLGQTAGNESENEVGSRAGRSGKVNTCIQFPRASYPLNFEFHKVQ